MIRTKLDICPLPGWKWFLNNLNATERTQWEKEKEERKVAVVATFDLSTLTVRLQQSAPFRNPKA